MKFSAKLLTETAENVLYMGLPAAIKDTYLLSQLHPRLFTSSIRRALQDAFNETLNPSVIGNVDFKRLFVYDEETEEYTLDDTALNEKETEKLGQLLGRFLSGAFDPRGDALIIE